MRLLTVMLSFVKCKAFNGEAKNGLQLWKYVFHSFLTQYLIALPYYCYLDAFQVKKRNRKQLIGNEWNYLDALNFILHISLLLFYQLKTFSDDTEIRTGLKDANSIFFYFSHQKLSMLSERINWRRHDQSNLCSRQEEVCELRQTSAFLGASWHIWSPSQITGLHREQK